MQGGESSERKGQWRVREECEVGGAEKNHKSELEDLVPERKGMGESVL